MKPITDEVQKINDVSQLVKLTAYSLFYQHNLEFQQGMSVLLTVVSNAMQDFMRHSGNYDEEKLTNAMKQIMAILAELTGLEGESDVIILER